MAQLDLQIVEHEPSGTAPTLIGQVRTYWQSKCADGRLPARAQIRPTEIKAWLPHILLADVISGGTDFRYRLVGTNIAQDFRSPPTGKLMSEVIAPYGAQSLAETLRAYRGVVESAQPLQLRGSGAWFAQGAKTFDAILMPLADDGICVNMILGAFVFAWDRSLQAPLSLLKAR